jgi:hypothetical protein
LDAGIVWLQTGDLLPALKRFFRIIHNSGHQYPGACIIPVHPNNFGDNRQCFCTITCLRKLQSLSETIFFSHAKSPYKANWHNENQSSIATLGGEAAGKMNTTSYPRRCFQNSLWLSSRNPAAVTLKVCAQRLSRSQKTQ